METKILNTSRTGAKKKNNLNSSKQLIKYDQIKNTPFTIVSKDNIHFIAIGNNRVSEETNKKEDLINKINERDYHLLGGMIACITEKIIELQQLKQTGK